MKMFGDEERSRTMTDTPADATIPQPPSREELQAELLPVPEPPDQPPPLETPGIEDLLAKALSYIRGKRGADLCSVILVGSGARRTLTPHSDLNLIVAVKGTDEGEEIARIADRFVHIRYRGHKAIEQEIPHAYRLPPLLRKGRVLYDHDMIGSKLIERAALRFRQGPPPASLNEKIHLKADCLHRVGKAEDLEAQPAAAQYLLNRCVDDLLDAYFRLRGFWPTAPADMLRFVATRDPAIGELLTQVLTAPDQADRLTAARELTNAIFKDVPLPARID
jgi:predicted nucleotidyltransferase